MTTNVAKPTGATNKVIVPASSYLALQQLARSRRLSAPPGLMLDIMFQQSGIFVSGWIPSEDYKEEVRTLHVQTWMFQRLQYVQSRLNADLYNFTLMDIVVANLIISGNLYAPSGEMIGVVQGKGIVSTQRGDILEHYNIQSDTLDWMATSAMRSDPHDTTDR